MGAEIPMELLNDILGKRVFSLLPEETHNFLEVIIFNGILGAKSREIVMSEIDSNKLNNMACFISGVSVTLCAYGIIDFQTAEEVKVAVEGVLEDLSKYPRAQ